MSQLDPSMLDPRKKLEQFQNIKTDYERKSIEASSDDSDRYTRRLKADKGSSFLEFIDDLRDLWIQRYGRTEEHLVDIVRKNATRKEDNRDVAITYKVMERTISPDFNDVKPKYRTRMVHPLRSDQHVEIYGQMFDMVIEFAIQGRTNEEADEIMEQFEDFITIYTSFFTRSGVQDIRFLRQLEDQTIRENEGERHMRTLLYTIRIERVTFKYLNEISHIELQAKLYKQK